MSEVQASRHYDMKLWPIVSDSYDRYDTKHLDPSHTLLKVIWEFSKMPEIIPIASPSSHWIRPFSYHSKFSVFLHIIKITPYFPNSFGISHYHLKRNVEARVYFHNLADHIWSCPNESNIGGLIVWSVQNSQTFNIFGNVSIQVVRPIIFSPIFGFPWAE